MWAPQNYELHDDELFSFSVGRHGQVVGTDTQKDISSQMLSFLESLEHLLRDFPEYQTPGRCDSTAHIKMLGIYRLEAQKNKIGGIFDLAVEVEFGA